MIVQSFVVFCDFFSFKDFDHGPEFMAMAQKLNEQYGLNITKTYDASSPMRSIPK